MANIVFDFLTESFLFNESYLETKYSLISENELKLELRKYREHIEHNFQSIIDEINQGRELINISIESFGQLPNEELLKQLALYLDRVVIPDPIFEFTHEKGSIHHSMSKLMGINPLDDIDRDGLVENILYMKNSTSLVVNQFVKYFPVSLIHEPPKELPIHYSKNNFSDALPPDIFKHFHEKVKVNNIEIVDSFMRFSEDKPLELGTTIHVGFDAENNHKGMVYQYAISQVTDVDEKTGKYSSRLNIPDVINDAEFRLWVSQSINRAALKTYTDTFNELVLSKEIGSMFLAKSQFTADLLSLSVIKQDIDTDLVNLSMQLDLPVFDKVSLNDIISIRCNEGEAFHNFRTDLNSKLLDLRTITDPEKLRIRLENVRYEINETQIANVNRESRKILRSLGRDIFILTGTLLTSFCTGGLTLIGAAGAALLATIDYTKYLKEVKENNGYFIWKLNKGIR